MSIKLSVNQQNNIILDHDTVIHQTEFNPKMICGRSIKELFY